MPAGYPCEQQAVSFTVPTPAACVAGPSAATPTRRLAEVLHVRLQRPVRKRDEVLNGHERDALRLRSRRGRRPASRRVRRIRVGTRSVGALFAGRSERGARGGHRDPDRSRTLHTSRSRSATTGGPGGERSAEPGECSDLAPLVGQGAASPPGRDGSPRTTSPERSHRAIADVRFAALHPREVAGIATAPARTVLDCARGLPFDAALAVADSALRAGDVDREEAPRGGRAFTANRQEPGPARGQVC